MRVYLVARGVPTEKYVRYGVFELDQAKALAESGHQVVYLSVDLRSIRRWRKWGLEVKVIDGVHVFNMSLPIGRLPQKVKRRISTYYLKKLYKKAAKIHGEAEIIHSHFINEGNITTDVFKSSNIPLVHTEHHSIMNNHSIDAHYYEIGKKTYNNVDKLITVSQSLSDNIKAIFDVESQVVPNIVDTKVFKYNPLINKGNDFIFISVGNLVPIKRMNLLIQSFAQAFEDEKKVKLYIYGDGLEYNSLLELIKKLQMGNQVFLKGEVKREVIAEQMAKSDAFVLASQKETFGVVFIEALTAGLPIITTKSGGPDDIVNTQNGLQIDVDNQQELVIALLHMYEYIHKFKPEEISNAARIKYSSKSISKILTKIYKELIV